MTWTLFVAGGASRIHPLNDDGLRSSVLSYETTTNTWLKLTTLNTPRFRAAMTLHRGDIYVTGGLSSVSAYRYSKDVECWSHESKTWRQIAATQTTRIGAKLHIDGQRLFIIGGLSQPAVPGVTSEIEAVQL